MNSFVNVKEIPPSTAVCPNNNINKCLCEYNNYDTCEVLKDKWLY